MGFYELGNGCDSCETISSVLPNNVNMQMDPNSSMVASMVMPYGTQNNMMKQYNGAIASGYATQGTNLGNMGMGSTGGSMGAAAPTMVVVPAAQAQAVKQVTAPGPVAVVVPAAQAAAAASPTAKANNAAGKVEGFTNSMNVQDMGKCWVVLGLVIFSALAGNECCKYFLNKSLQLNDGSPLYYVAYVGVAILLTLAAYTYVTKN